VSCGFELGVWSPDGDVITVSEYLEMAETAAWRPDPEDSAIILDVGHDRRLGEDWNLGNFRQIVAQVKACRERLAASRPGLLRSAVEDQATPPYLLFEPNGEQVVISLFFIEDAEVGALYPTDTDADAAQRLYAYVERHRSELLASLPEDLRIYAFEGVVCPTAGLLGQLDRAVDLGCQLLQAQRS
jgi:hypothetical protein